MSQQMSPEIIGDREKFLFYGDPGMGKTHAALTAPGPIYGLSVGAHNEFKTYYSKKFQDKYRSRLPEKDFRFDVVKEDFDPMNPKSATGFEMANDLLNKALEEDDKGIFQFETIVIDNCTVLTEYQVNKAISLQSGKGATLEKLKKDDVLEMADFEWKNVQSMMAKFLSDMFRADKHVVLVAHEWEQTVQNRATQTSDVIAIKPLFVGKQRDRVANTFDNVWRFYQTGQAFAARTWPKSQNPVVIAKSRIGGVISEDYMDVDVTDVIKKFKEHAAKMSALQVK